MAWSIRLSRAINAVTAQVMGRGTGIEKLRIVQDVENRQRWVFATVLAGGVGFGVGDMRSEDGVEFTTHVANPMVSSLGRIARLTLFSGPNCSLCDVCCHFFVLRY